jgi:hypothetical protein
VHTLGVRWRRWRPRPLQATPPAQAALLPERHAVLPAWPADREWLCVDEATGRRPPTVTAPWCLVDDVPEGPTGADHTKGHVDGAGAPLTGRPPDHLGSVLEKQACATCWRQLVRSYRNKRRRGLHERGEQQKGPPVAALLRDAAGRLVLTPPPAYSPERHLEERLWTGRRRVVTPTHWCELLRVDIHASRDFFCSLAGRQEEVRRLCTIKTPESLLALL